MTYYTSLPPTWRNAVAAILFIAMLALLVLCIYKYRCRRSLKACTAEFSLFAGFLVLLSYSAAAIEGSTVRFEIRLPYILLLLAAAVALALTAIGLYTEYVKTKNSPTSVSIRQALDNLDSGVCFTDAGGRIILINRAMVKLISGVLGSSPQIHGDIEDALNCVQKIQLSPPLYRLADGSVWSIDTVELKLDGLEGVLQTSAHDVTQIYNTGEGLKAENERLKDTNARMQLMLERLADRIREQETLKLKTQIHNDIGTSLIEISNIIEGGDGGDMEKQLARLHNAVSYFSNDYADEAKEKSLETAAKKANAMGAQLIINGAEITSPAAQALAYYAATECARNAINHAGASKIFADTDKVDDGWSVSFTNNGRAPEGEIKEGGGLTALRRQIEAGGGKMAIASSPDFRLTVYLPEERGASYD